MINPNDAHDAMIYKDGILDYENHDRILRERGYAYLNLPCDCGGSNDDGHLPCCGWGPTPEKIEHDCIQTRIDEILGSKHDK